MGTDVPASQGAKDPTTKTPQVSSRVREAKQQPSISQEAAHIAGAASETLQQTARDTTQAVTGAAASLSSDVKEAAQSFQRAAKEQASEFASDVGHEFKGIAEEQKARGAEAIEGFAHAIEAAASELESQSPAVAGHIRSAAKSVKGLSGNLRTRSVDELMQAASDLARSQPAIFLAGAVAAGFALSRFLKSSARSGNLSASSTPTQTNAAVSGPKETAGQKTVFPSASIAPNI